MLKVLSRFLKNALAFALALHVLSNASARADSATSAELPRLRWQIQAQDGGAKVRVGDPLPLVLDGLDPQAQKVVLPAFEAKSGWMLVWSGDSATKSATWTPLRAGEVVLPSLEVQDQAGKLVARTEPLTVQVQSSIASDDPQPKQPEPMYDALSVSPPWGWVTLVVVLAAGVLGFGIYLLVRKLRARAALRRAKANPIEELSEDEWAVRQLNQLQARKLWETGKIKAHYFRVSEILKSYIERRYSFDAVESTSSEVIEGLERSGLVPAQIDRLESQFEILDRVKFTDYEPSADEPPRIVEDAMQWIRATRRPIEVYVK